MFFLPATLRLRSFLALLGCLGLALLVGCGRGEEAAFDSLIVALEPDKDPDQILADQRTFTQYLTGITEQRVEVIIPLSAAVIHEGLRNGSIDVAYVNSTVAVRLEAAGIADLLVATEIDGKPSYESYWLGRIDDPYEKVEDLRGRPIAFSSRTSTSGFIIPVWDLFRKGLVSVEEGPEAFFGEGNVTYGVGYVSAVERVLQGRADAAAVSYYVFEKDKHLSPEQRSQLKVIARQGPVPSHVLVVRSALDAEVIAELRRIFLGMNSNAPELRDRLFGAPLIETDADTHYAVTREALAVIEQMQR